MPPPPAARHDPYHALRYPPFRRFLVGAFLVNVGTAVQGVAIGWEIYVRTDSALALGAVGLVQAVPMLLFTLPAGYLADVLDRRRLIAWSLAGSTLTSLGLALFSAGQGSIGMMYVLLFLDATFNRMGWPARSALVPLLVPRNAFENAVTLRTTLMQVSAMVGPAAGGFVVAWRLPAAYLLCAATSLVFMGLLARLAVADAPRAAGGKMWSRLAEGFRYVRGQQLLLGAISLDLFAVLLGGAVYLLPIFARDLLPLEGTGLSPEQALGWLRAAPAAGALCMALALTHLPPMKRAGRNLLLAVAGFGMATIVFGLSRNLWLSMAMLFLTGLFDSVSVVVRQTLVQLATPNEMRGRVSSVSAVFIGSSNELGGFESGLVARFFGPVVSVVSGGIGTLVVVAVWAARFPALRRVRTLAEAKATPPAHG
jgi:MFS family permease